MTFRANLQQQQTDAGSGDGSISALQEIILSSLITDMQIEAR